MTKRILQDVISRENGLGSEQKNTSDLKKKHNNVYVLGKIEV